MLDGEWASLKVQVFEKEFFLARPSLGPDGMAIRLLNHALELLKKDVVAIIGPQSSILAHIVSYLAKEIKYHFFHSHLLIPLLHHLSTHNLLGWLSNFSQMFAITTLVGYYDWREVIEMYLDDDYDQNGIYVLGDALGNVGAKITNKEDMPLRNNQRGMTSALEKLALVEAWIFIII